MSEPATGPESAAPEPRGGAAKTRRAWLLRVGGTALFLALFAFLVWRGTIDPGAVLATLGTADPWLVLLSVALYAPFVLVKAERWRMLAGDMGMQLGHGDALRLYAIGLGAGAFTPGQSGDLIKAWALSRRGYSLATAIWSSVLDRLFDVAGLGLLALLGIWVFGRELFGNFGLVALVAVAAIGGVLLIVRRDLLIRYVPALGKLLGPVEGGRSFRLSALLKAALLTVASFAISTYRVLLLVQAVHVGLSVVQVAGISALSTVAALVPISVGGVGTRDTIMVVLFQQVGESNHAALAVSALILLLNITHALFGYLVWIFSGRRDVRGAAGE